MESTIARLLLCEMGNKTAIERKPTNRYLSTQKRVNDIFQRTFAEIEALIEIELPFFHCRFSQHLSVHGQSKELRLLNIDNFCKGLQLMLRSHNSQLRSDEPQVVIPVLESDYRKDLILAWMKLEDERVHSALGRLINL